MKCPRCNGVPQGESFPCLVCLGTGELDVCPYCGVRPVWTRTYMYEIPRCFDCEPAEIADMAAIDAVLTAIDAVLTANGTKRYATDVAQSNIVQDCEDDAAEAAEREMSGQPPTMEGWVFW